MPHGTAHKSKSDKAILTQWNITASTSVTSSQSSRSSVRVFSLAVYKDWMFSSHSFMHGMVFHGAVLVYCRTPQELGLMVYLWLLLHKVPYNLENLTVVRWTDHPLKLWCLHSRAFLHLMLAADMYDCDGSRGCMETCRWHRPTRLHRSSLSKTQMPVQHITRLMYGLVSWLVLFSAVPPEDQTFLQSKYTMKCR